MKTIDKPNILFILADDWGWGDVSYHGSPIRTPNIDRLAASGVQLDQHYVCPTCSPTRASFITGRHPSRFGVHATSPTNSPVMPTAYETIATALRNCGYDTGLFGKWHLGSLPQYNPTYYGFNHAYGSLAGGVDPYNHRYKKGPYSFTWHRNGGLVEENGHVTDLIQREASQWIESRKNPWFCYVPFTAVHIPVKAPQSWIDRYYTEVFDDDLERNWSFQKYAAYASHMDHAVGQLVELLECTGQRDNTVIVFASDNGAMGAYPKANTEKYPGWHEDCPRLGSNLPLRGYKSQLYEGGIRTPTLINWRGELTAGVRRQPLHMVDWFPTFTTLAGYEPTDDLQWDGQNMWPSISGRTDNVDRSVYWNVKGGKFCLRRGEWKLITTADMKPKDSELFNIENDPYEEQELGGEKPEIVKSLLAEIGEYRELDDSLKRSDAPVGAEKL